MHGNQKERTALERERASREQLATTQLRVQQLEAEKAQQAAYAKRDLALIRQELVSALKTKHDLASALEKLKLQMYLQDNSSNQK